MRREVLRVSAGGVLVALLAACGGGVDTSKAFNQDDFDKSLTSYMTAAANNFSGFSADPPLLGTSECGIKNAGQPGAKAECKLSSGFDTRVEAMNAYTEQKDRVAKALPSNARTLEQKNAVPNTPLRFAAIEGKGALVLVLTKTGGTWVVAYVFQKAP